MFNKKPMSRISAALLLAATSVVWAEPVTSPISGFFGQKLGMPIQGERLGIYKGSTEEPSIHYIVRVPPSLRALGFTRFVVLVDTATGLVGGIQAKKLTVDAATCLKLRDAIDKAMAHQFKGAESTDTGSYRHGKRGASVWCSTPPPVEGTVLSVSVDDYQFNREVEDKYIRALVRVNAE